MTIYGKPRLNDATGNNLLYQNLPNNLLPKTAISLKTSAFSQKKRFKLEHWQACFEEIFR